MPPLTYNRRGLILKKGGRGSKQQIQDLQRDLRQLGYLASGIDGDFGGATERGVKALRYDLLHNAGKSAKDDGNSAVGVLDYNRGRVVDVTGIVDFQLAGCLSDMLDDDNFPKLPKTDDPVQENSRIVTLIKEMPSTEVPIPFLIGILQQESGLKHYNEPPKNDEDTRRCQSNGVVYE